jgi:hypothetical protein
MILFILNDNPLSGHDIDARIGGIMDDLAPFMASRLLFLKCSSEIAKRLHMTDTG